MWYFDPGLMVGCHDDRRGCRFSALEIERSLVRQRTMTLLSLTERAMTTLIGAFKPHLSARAVEQSILDHDHAVAALEKALDDASEAVGGTRAFGRPH